MKIKFYNIATTAQNNNHRLHKNGRIEKLGEGRRKVGREGRKDEENEER